LLTNHDPSNGWNAIAPEFIQRRQTSSIGTAVVADWAKQLPPKCKVLDLGCGFGVPISAALISQGFNVHGIDASPVLTAEFRKRFPNVQVRCEAVEASDFFALSFAGVTAISLMFLLPQPAQLLLIEKVAKTLQPGGRFLFTAPHQRCTWQDLLTGRESLSLGKAAYVEALQTHGLSLVAEFADEGENHHFSVVKK
jgi:2-polyprenyl-3-methyl-5-hydroxy-6-metoxy-1,4-benzoquinol methylase